MALLSSPFILIALAYFGRKLDNKIGSSEEKELRRWVLLANAKGRYSRGSSETILDQDLATIRNGGKGPELIDRLKQQVGRLDVAPEELEARNQRSGLFKTMFLAFRSEGAKDWRSNLTISLDHSGAQHQLQFHHIFPKKQLKNVHTSREADDIANLAFIGGKTNRVISDKPPRAVPRSPDPTTRYHAVRCAGDSYRGEVIGNRSIQGFPGCATAEDC